MTRETTKRLLDLMNEGAIDPKKLARDLLGYMSEDDVRDFAHANDYPTNDEDEGEDEPNYFDDQFANDAEADADVLRGAGMGTDEDYGYHGEDF